MTTNVFDGASVVVATDSRWSYRYGNYLIYLDDTGFEKIEVVENAAFMFAGRGDRVQEWKHWLRTNPTSPEHQPTETKGMSVCVVSKMTGTVIMSVGDYHVHEVSHFAGSGRDHARGCWIKNRDALKCVETAKSKDIYSGGEVKYFSVRDSKHNLYPSAPVTIQMVNNALHTRGLVMSINDTTATPSAVPFKMAAANDTGLEEFGKKIANGEISPSAPFDGMDRDWTATEKKGFDDALASVFGWK